MIELRSAERNMLVETSSFFCVWGCVGIQLRRSVMQWRGTTIFMPINGQTAVVHFSAKRCGWVREGFLRDLQPLHWLPVTSHQEPALYCWNVYDAEDVFCRFCVFCQIHRNWAARKAEWKRWWTRLEVCSTWHQPSLVCRQTCQVDQRPVGRSCQGEIGYWSPVCSGTQEGTSWRC